MRLHFNRQLSQSMRHLLAETESPFFAELNWLENAKIKQQENLFVFDRFKPKGKFQPLPGEDETGMECSLNHFHFACPDVQTGLALSIRIFDVVSALWQQSFGSEKGQIRQIVSMELASDFSGTFEATYRFHVIRENQSWLSSSLEDYEEIVLECE